MGWQIFAFPELKGFQRGPYSWGKETTLKKSGDPLGVFSTDLLGYYWNNVKRSISWYRW